MGVGGYDFQYTIERYKLRGSKLNPDMILWFVIDDDFRRIDEKQIIRTTLNSSQSKEPINDILYHSTWRQIKWQIEKELGGENKVLEFQTNLLNSFNNYYKKNLVIFSFQTMPQKYKSILYKYSKSRHGIYFFDGIPNIYGDHANFLNDGHPSAQGYKIIVSSLFSFLKKKKKNSLITCQ